MFVFVPPPPPSPRARELGEKMTELIRIYHETDPKISMGEIRQAMKIAEVKARSEVFGKGMAPQAAIAVMLGLIMLCGLLLFFFLQQGGARGPMVMIMVVGLIAVGLAVLIAIKR